MSLRGARVIMLEFGMENKRLSASVQESHRQTESSTNELRRGGERRGGDGQRRHRHHHRYRDACRLALSDLSPLGCFRPSAWVQKWFRAEPGCCSVGLCPGGGSAGRPPEAGDSMHDGKEGDLKQEEGFFSKLKKLFSSS